MGTIILDVPKAIEMTRNHWIIFELVEEVKTRCLFYAFNQEQEKND